MSARVIQLADFQQPRVEPLVLFTYFYSQRANIQVRGYALSLEELAGRIRRTQRDSKERLPWLKLARFGDRRSEKRCYRTNDNLVAITGVEGDYDTPAGTLISMPEAARRLERAGVRCLLYETASSTPERPRWRVFAPCSRPYQGDEGMLRITRDCFLARINGLLDGKLSGESFTLSQSYYFGGLEDKPPIAVTTVPGRAIDQCDDLDAGALFKAAAAEPHYHETGDPAPVPEDLEESDDDPWLLAEGARRVLNILRSPQWDNPETPYPTGTRAMITTQQLGDMRSGGLILSAVGIADLLAEDYPATGIGDIEGMLSRRNQPRGCEDIGGPPARPIHKPTVEHEEARRRVREAFQDWLARPYDHPRTVVAIKAPAGFGKTSIELDEIVRRQTGLGPGEGLKDLTITVDDPVPGMLTVAVPRHNLGQQMQADLAGKLPEGLEWIRPKAPQVRGRSAKTCQRWEEAQAYRARGQSPVELCRSRNPEKDRREDGKLEHVGYDYCPHYHTCPLIASHKAARWSDTIIVTHAHMTTEYITLPFLGGVQWQNAPRKGPAGVRDKERGDYRPHHWIDEDPVGAFIERGDDGRLRLKTNEDLPANILVTDATLSPIILEAVFPSYAVELVELNIRRNARVVQVRDRAMSRNWLLAEEHLPEVARWIKRLARRCRDLVVITTKKVRCAITGEDPKGELPVSISVPSLGVRIGHYGNIEGSNAFEGCDALVLLGREEPKVEDMEEVAAALWPDPTKPLVCIAATKGKDGVERKNYPKATRAYLMKDGSTAYAEVSTHPDPRTEALLEMSRESAMIQGLDRARLIHNATPKDVFILCNIPLPGVEVDALVTWEELSGENPLGWTLADAASRGACAVSLAPAELARRYPERWVSSRAAERWLQNHPGCHQAVDNPQNTHLPNNKIGARVFWLSGWAPADWNVVEYRQAGTSRWSRALVWSEHPAPQAAIAEELGVPTHIITTRASPYGSPRPEPEGLAPADCGMKRRAWG